MTENETKTESEKKRKRMVSVIRWPNGFINLVRVLYEHEGASIEQEVNWQIDKMCEDMKIPRNEIEFRVFNVSSIDIKDRL